MELSKDQRVIINEKELRICIDAINKVLEECVVDHQTESELMEVMMGMQSAWVDIQDISTLKFYAAGLHKSCQARNECSGCPFWTETKKCSLACLSPEDWKEVDV